MSEPNATSPRNSFSSLCSYRYQGSEGTARLLHPTTSFVTVNNKRTFRPPPFILCTLMEYFPDRVPLAFAMSSAPVRLFTESSGSRGGQTVGARHPGLYLEGYTAVRPPTEPFVTPCEDDGVVEDDEPPPRWARGSLQHRGRTLPFAPLSSPGTSANQHRPGGSFSSSAGSPSSFTTGGGGGGGWGSFRSGAEGGGGGGGTFIQAYPFYLYGPSFAGGGSSTAEQHRYPRVGYHAERRCCCGSGGLSGGTSGLGGGGGGGGPFTSSLNDRSGSRSPSTLGRNGSRTSQGSVSPPPQPVVVVGGGNVGGATGTSPESLAAEQFVCESCCWRGGLNELSLCPTVRCTSLKGLHMVLFSSWWLSRYFGIELIVDGLRQRDQYGLLKEIVRVLSIRSLTVIRGTLTQDWLQHISACTDLIALSFVGCVTAKADIPFVYVNPILTKQGQADPQRQPCQSRWYLSGNLSVSVLRHLKCLHIVNTPVKQEFIDSLPACAGNLECVLLHRCRGFTTLHPLANLKALRCVSVQNSAVEDNGVQALGDCKRLQRLCLVECRRLSSLRFLLKDVGQSLRQLTLSHNWFADEHMRHVANCTELTELNLYYLKRLTTIDALTTLKKLEILNVGDTTLTNDGAVAALSSTLHLTRLNLSSCAPTTSIAAWLPSQADTLTALDLSYSSVDNEGLGNVSACTRLRYLDLSDCTKVSSVAALTGIDGLRWLSLAGTEVTDQDLNQHLRCEASLPGTLRYLSLRDCKNVNLLEFARHLPALAYLDLESTGVSDFSLLSLQRCRALRYLSLCRCQLVSSVQALQSLRKLCELHLSYTGINEAGLSAVGGCVALEVLHVRGCRQLTSLAALGNLSMLKELWADSFGQGRQHSRSHSLYQSARVLSPLASASGGFGGNDDGSNSYAHYRAHSPRSLNSVASLTSPPNAATSSPRLGGGGGGGGGGQKAHSCSSIRGGAGSSSLGADNDAVDNYMLVAGQNGTCATTAVPLRSLEDLSVRKSALNEAGLAALLWASKLLTRLTISECHYLSDLRGLEHLTSLCELNATQCTNLTNAGVAVISGFSSLLQLSLAGCTSVTELNVLGSLEHLEELDASQTRVTEQGLVGLGQCGSLRRLSLADCRHVTAVHALASLALLRELTLESTPVTDSGIARLVGCRSLERLSLKRCRHVTDVTDLRGALKQLDTLDVYGTSIPSRFSGDGRGGASGGACCVA